MRRAENLSYPRRSTKSHPVARVLQHSPMSPKAVVPVIPASPPFLAPGSGIRADAERGMGGGQARAGDSVGAEKSGPICRHR